MRGGLSAPGPPSYPFPTQRPQTRALAPRCGFGGALPSGQAARTASGVKNSTAERCFGGRMITNGPAPLSAPEGRGHERPSDCGACRSVGPYGDGLAENPCSDYAICTVASGFKNRARRPHNQRCQQW